MDEQPQGQPFPNYNIPGGIPVAPHPKHASVLMKMIKMVGKIKAPSPKKSGRTKSQTLKVEHKKKSVIWY